MLSPESPPLDDLSRFRALHEESLELLTAARSLVADMRSALDDCRRHRPVVEPPSPASSEPPTRPAARTHRGGRVVKAKRSRRLRRPK